MVAKVCKTAVGSNAVELSLCDMVVAKGFTFACKKAVAKFGKFGLPTCKKAMGC